MTTQTEHKAELVKIDSLKHYKGNARVGNIDVIRESLRKNGQYRPLVVRTQTREVLAGNHTWEAAKEEGWTEIWVTWIKCDAQSARRINMVDNKAPELGSYNEEALVAQLAAMPELEGTGWTDTEKQRLTGHLILGVGGDTDPEPVPDVVSARRGDLWLLGPHRLLCGDATNAQDVNRLLDDREPICMWTDPPYLGPADNSAQGDEASPRTVGHSVDSLRQMLAAAFELANTYLAKGAALYVFHPGGPNSVLFGDAFVAQGWRVRQTLVWLKESMNLGGLDYHSKHEMAIEGDKYEGELIAYGFAAGQRQNRGWWGDRKQCSVLQFDRPPARSSTHHPTRKPVGLVERLLMNSTPKGGLVFDPFVGSGTTLIAAENLGRVCCCMEIDPGYCDVIVDRWQRHTGRTAALERSDD